MQMQRCTSRILQGSHKGGRGIHSVGIQSERAPIRSLSPRQIGAGLVVTVQEGYENSG